MMQKVTIYHNPRCSKSRQSLVLLTDAKVEVNEVRYLQSPPTIIELDDICLKLDIEPLELIRHGESRFKELGLKKTDPKKRMEWLKIMVENPILIQRPIIIMGNQAIIGRPPELVKDLLETYSND